MKVKKKEMEEKKIIKRYVPTMLTKKDRKKQYKMIEKSKKMYKLGKYYTRKNIKSFHNKKSNHILDAQRIYNIDTLEVNNELSEKTGCSKDSLLKIINKGEGAYFSSGSRPNQTAQSWGIARLASAITSGKAAAVDYNILENGCKLNSKALYLAKKSKKKYGTGRSNAKKISIKNI
jgi:hypothetical protein